MSKQPLKQSEFQSYKILRTSVQDKVPGCFKSLGTVKERTSVWLSKKEIIRVYGERLIAIAGRARNADGFFLWLIRIHCCNSKSPLWKY